VTGGGRQEVDVVVLGGGVAGATILAHLAGDRRVVLVEREPACGYHTTGRSAAMFLPSYGAAAVWTLTLASQAFLERPPQGFGGTLLRARDVLHVGRKDQLARLAALERRIPSATRLTGAAARERVPILQPTEVAAAVLETGAGDIDVHRLHQGLLRAACESGARILESAGEVRLSRTAGLWRVRARDWEIWAPIVVNATGAWADETAAAAGVVPRGLRPLQRTVILVDPPVDPQFLDWPIVKDVDERFYFRPFGGRLLITPADETPSAPCDAHPDVLDVACAMMRFEDVALHPVRTVRRRWAGLRTFAADRAPVIGWDGAVEGFFWFAGFGGFGIQTAPAAGRLAAGLIRDGKAPRDLLDQRVDPAAFDPGRPGLDGDQIAHQGAHGKGETEPQVLV
jgi:D-arginine dehydrogenase